MPYIPHTAQEIQEMLDTIGIDSIDRLFEEIPKHLINDSLEKVPEQASEMEVAKLIQQKANSNKRDICFIGAGAYEHYIPAPVWELASRGEYYSAYTPYQAEASQGTLQLLYEYQTMMTRLTDMDVSNASLYDGASALAEGVLMAVRTHRKSRTILMPRSVHPHYQSTVKSLVGNQDIKIQLIDYIPGQGQINLKTISDYSDEFAAIVLPYPNFFGIIEDVDSVTDLAHKLGALVIAVVNPVALGILKPPGQWGADGADIVCGEGQPLGIPLNYGGPYFGFMCCKEKFVRQMPGRIIGRTVDLDGKPGFTLTLQAREQHIRRSKATSNICTNQGLMVTAATIHMALLGSVGLEKSALMCHKNMSRLTQLLTHHEGIEKVFSGPHFHESVFRLSKPVDFVLQQLATQNLLGGYNLESMYPELVDCLLICTTEMRTTTDIDFLSSELNNILSQQ